MAESIDEESTLSKIVSESRRFSVAIQEITLRLLEEHLRTEQAKYAVDQRLHRLELAVATLIRKGVIDEQEIAE